MFPYLPCRAGLSHFEGKMKEKTKYLLVEGLIALVVITAIACLFLAGKG